MYKLFWLLRQQNRNYVEKDHDPHNPSLDLKTSKVQIK